MLYELRIYSVVPGRVGDTLERFRSLPRLFERHGIDNVGRWHASAGHGGPNFVYMMAYRDFAEREAQWNAFYLDDEWWAYRTETNAGEEMTERFDLLFLRPNPAWTPGPAGGERIGGVHELTIAEVAVGQNGIANAYLEKLFVPLVSRAGGRLMLLADLVSGVALPKIAWMIAWPDAAAREKGRELIDTDPESLEAIRSQRQDRGRAAIGKHDTWLLAPSDYLLPIATLGNPRPA
jgi:hypothetical protein